MILGVSRRGWLVAAGLLAAFAAILFAMGRPPICPCGIVSLWHGVVQSNQNSQQVSDWYSFSHVIHGFIFYGLGRWLLPNQPLWVALALAIGIEAAWEILENSPIIIDRYREVTMAYGYSGDSILNSVSDALFMMIGFLAASRMRWWVTVAIAIAFELFTLWAIRDNLTLNVLMLVSPVEAIKEWQSGG
ncbi:MULTISPECIES: DUF2585 domain-containing protein [Sphingopyxis]|uniref:DUF2585 domain-containing protein n=1 Tax=Sphingopyxis TaxID=165697 RepID=UPI0015C7690B|nr:MULTISPECIES: DUF2585 domain-containing protein [Sphingopyxis]NYF33197.1 hypothetical protein [Sphingopyxis sp. JAI108]